MIQNGIKEDLNTNISNLWNFSKIQSANTTFDKADLSFLNKQNDFLLKEFHLSKREFNSSFNIFKSEVLARGESEIQYWENRISEIKKYSREEAISFLLKSLKLNEKIKTIHNFMKDLQP